MVIKGLCLSHVWLSTNYVSLLYPFSPVVRRTLSTAQTPEGHRERAPDGENAATIKSLGTIVSGEERANVLAQHIGHSGSFGLLPVLLSFQPFTGLCPRDPALLGGTHAT